MRAVVLVIDSFGIGALPDASDYGDEGSNTAAHICSAIPGEKWPHLKRMGLGNAATLLGEDLAGCEAVEVPEASFGVMAERSPGKDTTTGHWELMGVVLRKAFRTFPPERPSFPAELTDAFVRETGREFLGNCAASGTVIIQELGEEHLRTGRPIIYTSGDSVFQIAAHESVIPVEELYRICETARRLCDPYSVARVIARPFIGDGATGFTRTSGRRDFSMVPTGETLLDRLCERSVETVGVGKIGDIFTERGIVTSYHDKGNEACLKRTLDLLQAPTGEDQFIFVNLVDTDMIFGHRRDVRGYADAVSAVDAKLPLIQQELEAGDVMVVTADHGCDPTFRGTDHTREHVPLLWYEPAHEPTNLGVRTSFADLSQTLASRFGAGRMAEGTDLFR